MADQAVTESGPHEGPLARSLSGGAPTLGRMSAREIEPLRRMVDESPVESLLSQPGVDEVVVTFPQLDGGQLGEPVVEPRRAGRPHVDRDNAA